MHQWRSIVIEGLAVLLFIVFAFVLLNYLSHRQRV